MRRACWAIAITTVLILATSAQPAAGAAPTWVAITGPADWAPTPGYTLEIGRGAWVINATNGGHSLDALEAAGAERLAGKILVDVANPLDTSRGMPPTLLFCNTESLAERIQAAFPDARVVKTLNTTNAQMMVDPRQLTEPTAMFVSGNDQEAKDWVHRELLEHWFGWEQVLDLGDITAARGQEMWIPLWLRLMGATGTAAFNLRIVAST